LLPDIIKLLTAMTKLAADEDHVHPDAGLNKFPGTILAATYNERHAASNAGGSTFIAEVPATQLRASPLLEGLLWEAVRQLRDERRRLFAARRFGPSLELQAHFFQERFKAELFGMIRIISKLRFHHAALLEEIAAGFMQSYHASAPGTIEASRDLEMAR